MSVVRINAKEILDEASFHSVFKNAFGFPDFYGANMDAWIDCMSDLRASEEYAPMSRFSLKLGDVLTLEVDGVEDLGMRCPGLMQTFIECLAAVNGRYRQGKMPPISTVFF